MQPRKKEKERKTKPLPTGGGANNDGVGQLLQRLRQSSTSQHQQGPVLEQTMSELLSNLALGAAEI